MRLKLIGKPWSSGYGRRYFYFVIFVWPKLHKNETFLKRSSIEDIPKKTNRWSLSSVTRFGEISPLIGNNVIVFGNYLNV